MTRLEQENNQSLKVIAKSVNGILKFLVTKELRALDVYDDIQYKEELKKIL